MKSIQAQAFLNDPLKFLGLPSLSSAGLEGLVVDTVDMGGDTLLGREALEGAGVDCGCNSRFSD